MCGRPLIYKHYQHLPWMDSMYGGGARRRISDVYCTRTGGVTFVVLTPSDT